MKKIKNIFTILCVLILTCCVPCSCMANATPSNNTLIYTNYQKYYTKTKTETDFAQYMTNLQKQINRNWNPPKKNKSTKTVVSFLITKNGYPQNIKILKSSGDASVDNEAIKTIKKSAPFEPLPFNYKSSGINIQFTFNYNVPDNKNNIANEKKFHKYCSKGHENRQKGNYKKALKNYKKAISIYPKKTDIYAYIIESDLYLKNYVEAKVYASKAINIDNKNSYAYYARGLAEYNLEQYKDALIDFSTAIKLQPNFYTAYTMRATIEDEIGDYNHAINDLNKAVKLKPNMYKAYYHRAKVRTHKLDLTGAIRDCNKAIALAPNKSSLYALRGYIKFMLIDLNGALKDYNKTFEFPDENDAYQMTYYNRALLKWAADDYKSALEDAKIAAKLYKANGDENSYYNTLKIIKNLKKELKK